MMTQNLSSSLSQAWDQRSFFTEGASNYTGRQYREYVAGGLFTLRHDLPWSSRFALIFPNGSPCICPLLLYYPVPGSCVVVWWEGTLSLHLVGIVVGCVSVMWFTPLMICTCRRHTLVACDLSREWSGCFEQGRLCPWGVVLSIKLPVSDDDDIMQHFSLVRALHIYRLYK